MKAPERLFSSDPDLARLREVLDRDGPPHGASDRAMARVLADAVPNNASHEAKAASPGPSIKPWLVAGIGATVLVAGLLVWSSWRQTPGANPAPLASAERMATAERNASVTPDQATVPSATDARPAGPAIHVDDLPTAPRPVTAPSPAGTADPFLDELSLVERARAALAQGRGRECLEATKSYETKFAKGAFREEVEVMHIEALAMSGERAAARARGERFLDVHTDTPYVERVRRVLDQAAE